MDTKTTFAMMEKALPYVMDLLHDEDVTAFKERFKTEGAENITMAEAMEKLMPIFLLKKRDCVISLLAAVTDKTEQQIEEQDYSITKIDLKNALIGDVFDFFGFALHMAVRA